MADTRMEDRSRVVQWKLKRFTTFRNQNFCVRNSTYRRGKRREMRHMEVIIRRWSSTVTESRLREAIPYKVRFRRCLKPCLPPWLLMYWTAAGRLTGT